MTLTQALPDPTRIREIVATVTGDGAAETGLAAALAKLQSLNLQAGVSALVDELGDVGGSIDLSSVQESVARVQGDLEERIATMPADPGPLLAPLLTRIDEVRQLIAPGQWEALEQAAQALQNTDLGTEGPPLELMDGLARGLEAIRQELLSGSFAQLSQWAQTVDTLRVELEPIFEGDAAGLLDRVIQWVGRKVADVVAATLPGGTSLLLAAETQLTSLSQLDPSTAVSFARDEVVGAIDELRQRAASGIDAPALQPLRQRLDDLVAALDGVGDTLEAALDAALSPEQAVSALARQFDQFAEIEIVDLGNIRERFREALNDLQNHVRVVDLDSVRQRIDGFLQPLDELIGQLDPTALQAKLSEPLARLQELGPQMQSAVFEVVAPMANLLRDMEAQLRELLNSMGEFDEQGRFRFAIVQEIETFLQSSADTIENTMTPALQRFREQIAGALAGVGGAVQGLDERIAAAQTELTAMFESARTQFQELDLEGRVAKLGEQFDTMLGELDAVNFDVIVNPVIQQIDEMREDMASIDLSSLSEAIQCLLGEAVKVVTDIEFASGIREPLIEEMEELLEVPRDLLQSMEAAIGGAVRQVATISLDAVIEPIQGVFDPLVDALDEVKLDGALAPVDQWHAELKQHIEQLAPGSLLQPVAELHERLSGLTDRLSLDELVGVVRAPLDELGDELSSVDVSLVSEAFADGMRRLDEALTAVSPQRLVAPLGAKFDKVEVALDRVRASALLEPIKVVFDRLFSALAGATAGQLETLTAVLGPLRQLPNAFSPQKVLGAHREVFERAADMLRQADVGGLFASLQPPFVELEAAVSAEAAGADAELIVDVRQLNPLRHEPVQRVIRRLLALRQRVDDAFRRLDVTDDLQHQYEAIQQRVDSLVPVWLKRDITPQTLERELRHANPLDVADEADDVLESLREQLRAFHPNQLADQLEMRLAAMRDKLSALDPDQFVKQITDTIAQMSDQVRGVNLQLLTDELNEPIERIAELVSALDPAPIIEQLDELNQGVLSALDAAKPSQVLAGVDAMVTDLKDQMQAFSPSAVIEPVKDALNEVQMQVKTVDLTSLREPIEQRLEQLREELVEAVGRTEVAFDKMLQAIPTGLCPGGAGAGQWSV